MTKKPITAPRKILRSFLDPFIISLRSLIRGRRRGSEEKLPFSRVFGYFRDVLNSNTKALEIMADMGDKLSGDYLFDINYLRRAYSDLSEAVNNSIRSFDTLTGNKYPELHDVLARLDGRIKKMVYGEGISVDIPLVIPLDDITWDMRRAVGGKIANLAEVKNYLKLDIPYGFAITSSACEQFIRYNGIDRWLKRLDEMNPDELKGLIINGNIPPDLDNAIEKAIQDLLERGYHRCAIRSSAEEEDSEVSFAGQFETVLNVPLNKEDVEDAYKTVIASLFSEKAMTYQKRFDFEPGSLRMAAGCLVMIDAKISGVIYTEYYLRKTKGILISATWGLGKAIVEGQVDADRYFLSKESEPRLIEKEIGKKERSIVGHRDRGIEEINTPDELRRKECLTEEDMKDLARIALIIERHFGRPQDIEWAIDHNGKLFILQSRPLTVISEREKEEETSLHLSEGYEPDEIIIKDKGIIVQKGVGAGRVFILRHMEQLDRFPKGAILVAGHDSSEFVRIMPYASAIVTDIGSPTSHMASLSREFRIPTIVNAGDATALLRHGQEITVKADDEGMCIYNGIKKGLLEKANISQKMLEEIYEFRKKRYILRHITPLNLTDPLREDFKPEGCKTFHDILRFIHEKSVEELIKKAERGAKGYRPVRLKLPIPAGISVIDIGGALRIKEGERTAGFDDIISVPLRAIIKGMLYPGVWHSDMVALSMHDFITGMMRAPEITAETTANSHVAIASAEYVNLNLRFGYHLNMIDCFCSENPRNNHIYFRFMGGATDITKRTRRIQLIAEILREYGFNIKTEGDIIISRLGNIRQDEMENILDQLGRLIAYTRQLDAVLHDDSAVERYARKFIEGEYKP